jgi:prephenate dehydrogenase
VKFSNILIYGLGLMGGSLSLALKNKFPKIKTTGILRSKLSCEEAIQLKIADKILLEEELIKNPKIWYDHDFIIFSLPVDLTCQKILSIPNDYKGFLTDLGSTKSEIITTVDKKFLCMHNYYSSHPMTGSELSGAKNSKANLYDKKLTILTNSKNTSPKAKELIKEFWEELNTYTIEIEPDDHDLILAYLSHSPHILSSIMVNWVNENKKVNYLNSKSPIPISGGGFRDMSRIAGSNPEMWGAIINSNKDQILHSLIDFQKHLNSLISILRDKNENENFWLDYFQKSKISRNEIMKLNENQ